MVQIQKGKLNEKAIVSSKKSDFLNKKQNNFMLQKREPATKRIFENIERIKNMDISLQKKKELLKQNYFELEVFQSG